MNHPTLVEANPDALLADGFEEAYVGYATRINMPPVAVYDRTHCIEILVSRDGMSYEEAEEFFSFNTEGAYMGENTPIYLYRGTL
jgi:hypothetical protein